MSVGKGDSPDSIEQPSEEEISAIWKHVRERQADTGRDQWVVGSAKQTNRRLHLRADENTLCKGHSGELDDDDSKPAAAFPEGYHDVCLHCVARWRAER